MVDPVPAHFMVAENDGREREKKQNKNAFNFMAFMHCFSSFTPVATAYNDDFIRIYIKIELVKKISFSKRNCPSSKATCKNHSLKTAFSLILFDFAWCFDLVPKFIVCHYGSNIKHNAPISFIRKHSI